MEDRIDALMRITQAIETAETLDELLLLALHQLSQLFDVPRGGVVLLDEESHAGQIVCEYPPQIVRPDAFQLDDMPRLQRALDKRESLQVKDTDYPQQSWPWELLDARDIRSALLVPLVAQDHAIGLLALGSSDRERYFNPDEVALVRTLGGQLAAAISAFRIHDEAQRRSHELSTLNEIASTITSTLDTREVYRLVVQRLNAYFNVEAGSLLLLDELTGDLRFVMTIEGGEARLAGVTVPMGQGVVGAVAQSGQWEIVRDVERDPRFYRKVSEDLGFVTRSILCVPMIAKGRVIGAIELLNKLGGHFTADEAARLMRMAAFIGVAIENARLFQQVADGRDQLAAILNSTADGILMTDMHGVVLMANPKAAELFRAGERQLLGRPLEDLLRDLHGRAREVITRARGSGESVRGTDETPMHVSDIELGGMRHRFLRHLTMPVRDKDGAVYAQLAVLRDITQEKELEQLRDDWTSMLVHDLRAPLTSIMNGVMMVKRGMGGPVTDAQTELLDISYQGSQAMLELVNNLLDIAKMEQGRLNLDLELVAPYSVIAQTIERLQVSARSKQVAIEQRVAINLPLIEADDKLVRVLQNLLDNALKFSPSAGTVTVGAHCYAPERPLPPNIPLHPPMTEGEWLIFWVQDRGMGIPAAYHERIFEKFGQVRGRKVRGTGLGLTFCKLAIEAHGGRIWLESDEGAGSVFAFGLPVKRNDDE